MSNFPYLFTYVVLGVVLNMRWMMRIQKMLHPNSSTFSHCEAAVTGITFWPIWAIMAMFRGYDALEADVRLVTQPEEYDTDEEEEEESDDERSSGPPTTPA
jgi:hypothetical protein